MNHKYDKRSQKVVVMVKKESAVNTVKFFQNILNNAVFSDDRLHFISIKIYKPVRVTKTQIFFTASLKQCCPGFPPKTCPKPGQIKHSSI